MDGHDSLPVLIRSAGGEGLVRGNRAFLDRLGLTDEQLADQELLDWIHPEDRQHLGQRLESRSGCATARHRTRSGEWVNFDWTVRAHGDDTVVYGHLHQDSRAAEPAPRPMPEIHTLSETLDTMARIVESKNPGMRCSILFTDSSRQAILGGAGPSLPDAYNKAVEGLRIGPGVGSCGTAAFWNRPVVVEDIARDPLWRDLRDAADLAGVASCWSQPIVATSGEVIGAMALYADEPRSPAQHQMDGLEIAARMVGLAVERDRLEEQLRQAMKMEAIGVLAGGIAHDFNNLLAVVLGSTEMALDSLPARSEARPMLEEALTASLTASDLCNQLLAYAGRGARVAETFDCNRLIEELGGLMQVALSKKARLVFELGDEPLGVQADRGQFRQVILNLITNAAEAVGDQAGRVTIHTSARFYTQKELEHWFPDMELEAGEYALLRITDTGTGMDAETRARIFDPFFTTKPSGRGLGLAAVQGIVRSHGGAITLDSTPGVGTTFSVLLPHAPVVDEDEGPEPGEGTDHQGARILVVDDEPKVREVLGGVLERAGYQVLRAADGREALDVFRAEADNIDCVLLDLSMPELDGEEVFREMKKLRQDVRVVLSSGFTEQEVLDRFQGAGLAGVVQKPTRARVLLARIAEAMSRSTA